jgi:hypothetical protein
MPYEATITRNLQLNPLLVLRGAPDGQHCNIPTPRATI